MSSNQFDSLIKLKVNSIILETMQLYWTSVIAFHQNIYQIRAPKLIVCLSCFCQLKR